MIVNYYLSGMSIVIDEKTPACFYWSFCNTNPVLKAIYRPALSIACLRLVT